jgi:hypothetical protein
MAILGKIGRFIMTPARKLALKKAQRAAARAARRRAKSIVRKKAIKKVAKMKFKRSASGLLLNSNFKGRAGRQLKRATYASRLASSRAKYGKAFTKEKLLGEFFPGLTGGQGVIRRRYADLTLGENFRRNISRNIKLVPVNVAIGATSAVIAISSAERKIEKQARVYSANNTNSLSNQRSPISSNSHKKAALTKYTRMS